MVAFFCVGVFFALIYVKARARTQEYALQRLWMMMWFVGVPASMGISYKTPRVHGYMRIHLSYARASVFVCVSLLATCYRLLATCHWLLATCYRLLATWR